MRFLAKCGCYGAGVAVEIIVEDTSKMTDVRSWHNRVLMHSGYVLACIIQHICLVYREIRRIVGNDSVLLIEAEEGDKISTVAISALPRLSQMQ